MAAEMEAAPVLSTPETRILEATDPVALPQRTSKPVSDEELSIVYDIERTLNEIRRARYKRISLQFPDAMLPDAPRVFQLLSRGLRKRRDAVNERTKSDASNDAQMDALAQSADKLNVEEEEEGMSAQQEQVYILGDTSYGACCVDEVAAEHVDADVVVHYGRSCLSPTARLPVIYVFTHKHLPIEHVIRAFKATYPDPMTKVLIAADVTYCDHVPEIFSRLVEEGYANLFATRVVHDPSSAIPNRTVPLSAQGDPDSLSEWRLFHISDPPTALLLTLASRVAAVHIYPTDNPGNDNVQPLSVSAARALSRRYAILTSLSTVPIFGILINTLSVKNYLHIVDHVRRRIAEAGKKSYMFVVGKLNAAKVANFSEIGGWVVIGCWESSLVDSKDFWKPVITPFELELALQSDSERVWTGAWQSDFQTVLDNSNNNNKEANELHRDSGAATNECADEEEEGDMSEPESAPPEFDLRTGRYVSNSRPMWDLAGPAILGANGSPSPARQALARRAKGDLATVGGAFSPGAEFLRSQRTWKGLGSDFDIQDDNEDAQRDSTLIVEGRKGIAKGYTIGENSEKH